MLKATNVVTLGYLGCLPRIIMYLTELNLAFCV
jgi:hypothetical protein